MTSRYCTNTTIVPKNVLHAGLLVALLLTPAGCYVKATSSSSSSSTRRSALPPNIVIVLTDDLDWTLGGTAATTLRRTRRLIGEAGKTFMNWFVQTPVCCPSRAELLTGKALHNLRTPGGTRRPGCMHVDVQADRFHPFYSRDYFAKYFASDSTNGRNDSSSSSSSSCSLNYAVGIFGKHLNSRNPTDFLPAGVDEMLINGGGAYLDPTFTVGNRGPPSTSPPKPTDVTFDNCTATTGMPCYSTSVIGNASLAWIRRHIQSSSETATDRKPFMALISVKAPHLQDGPGLFPLSVPAPWYQNGTFIPEATAPRTPNYNRSAPDHHWLVRSQLPLTATEAEMVDELYVSRLKTLLSVDDLVEDLIRSLHDCGVLDDTYILFTSDNGYRLGQFQMPNGKFHPYENDIRVPMMIRGPGIRPGSVSDLLATHVDLMPTLLGLATGHTGSAIIPDTMDGTNLAGWIAEHDDDDDDDDDDDRESYQDDGNDDHRVRKSRRQRKQQQRQRRRRRRRASLLIEYPSLGQVVRYNHSVDIYNHSFLALRVLHDEDDEGHGHGGFPLRNWKYVEFRDSRSDWNCTKPPIERELFDLDSDPYELRNLVRYVTPANLRVLEGKVQRMFRCRGETCRLERAESFALPLLTHEAAEAAAAAAAAAAAVAASR